MPIRIPTEVHIPPTLHHVTGKLKKERCPFSLKSAKLRVIESWYVLSGLRRLIFPNDRLSVTGRSSVREQLLQDKMLGEVVLTDTAEQQFDIDWYEVNIFYWVPWREKVLNERTKEEVVAYRILSLEVSSAFIADLVPIPFIMFFGDETTKDVGLIKLNCRGIDS